jgi:processive 1,2-diacylglycerol beta-glucosyltransferase
MARILILHASVGLGHKRAAEALGQAFAQRHVAQVWVEDTLSYGSPLFRQLYAGSYLELAEKAPALWAYYYQRADETESELNQALRRLVDRLGVTRLETVIEQRRPDAIVCTHFLPLDLLIDLRRRGRQIPPLYCVVTDYTGHAFWAYPDADGYFVATSLTAAMLVHRGVPADSITVTGIPVEPAIAEAKDRARLRRAYQLGDGAVIMFLASGLSAERVHQIAHGLLQRPIRGTLLLVTGRNSALRAGLRALPRDRTLRLRVHGFIDYLDDLVAASDLVITKAGGLIVSEVLARGRPLVIIDPVPGQEEWNADYVVSVGAGVQLRLGAIVPEAVEHLLNETAHRQLLENGAARAGRPRAALDIAAAVLAACRGTTSGPTGWTLAPWDRPARSGSDSPLARTMPVDRPDRHARPGEHVVRSHRGTDVTGCAWRAGQPGGAGAVVSQ